MSFADIKFFNKESVTTQAFAFSRFKKQTPELYHDCHTTWIRITDETLKEDQN